ncbi:neutral/alkaline non-lysosomal ceramidase N-terminal domain-containing protein [Tenacibaculum amylolyticum]|uniref:neutral/alkaline non-lysosomal ceramidase N-terminal domain-containing protein n=1 Tax=Tenacibaculum amylolyticum TaxID=104269 RepID=UPI00389343BD
MLKKINLTLIFCIILCKVAFSQDNNYVIGTGIYDITGQIAETNFFGHGNPFFQNKGIKDRQYARAYIIKDSNQNSVVFVSIDKGATFQSVNLAVLNKLNTIYGNLYNDTNVVISATHTHSSPGGYSHYDLYNVSTGGFFKTNFDILVNGIINAIKQAHNNLSPGRIYINKGHLTNASINRSLVAYNLNKDASDFSSIDDEMTVLKFVQGNKEVGMISWFGVHPTSLTKKYKYCSGDNKGHASLKFERLKHSSYGKGEHTFVAAFPNTNPGDMSPNLNLPAPGDHYSEATGPGSNEEESVEIIGNRQYHKALELYNNATEQLRGSVKAVSRYSDFSSIIIDPKYTDGNYQSTCKAALGISFRAGAEDGRSGIEIEGRTRSNPNSGPAVDRCHMEKPIDPLFFIGSNDSNPRTPKILPTSILKIGQLAILAAPGEFTVMSGRRTKATVAEHTNLGLQHLVFAGYSDAYAGYVTTREEYASQQYEGASTHFGPWTLAAYRQQFDKLAQQLANSNANPWSNPEPTPPQKSFLGLDKTPFILFDDKPLFKSFGSVYSNTNNYYNSGQTASVTFWGAHPNNDNKVNGTYFTVEKKEGSKWITKFEDRDLNTKLIWKRSGIANSKITIQFKITPDVESGYYRIVHTGKWKSGWNYNLYPYTGISNIFYVNVNQSRQAATNKETVFKAPENLIFPNPTNGTFTFINTQKQTGSYNIVNAIGQSIHNGKISSKQHQNISFVGKTGVYFLHVFFDNGEEVKTSVIKK